MQFRWSAAVCSTVLALMLAACAGREQGFAPPGPEPAPRRLAAESCPAVSIRPGGQAFVSHQGAANPANVRFQASILDTARECYADQGALNIHVGVAGRIIAGPRGSSGSATARLRITVVQNGQNVFSQTYTVSADIGPPAYGGDFALVEEGIVIPLPPLGAALEVLVGFEN